MKLIRSYYLICLLCCLALTAFAQEEDAMQLFARAENLRKSNNFIAAIEEYDRAIALDGQNPKFHFCKAQAYISLKDYDNAVLALDKTVALKQDFVQAYTLIAKCYQENKRFLKVADNLQLAFNYEEDPKKKNEYKITIIRTLYDNSSFDLALKHIQELKAFNPQELDAYYYEATIQNARGNYAAAKEAMVKATALLTTSDPKVVAKFYYELGFAYNKLGEFEKSQEAFQKANYGPYKALIAQLSPKYYTTAAASYMRISDYTSAKNMLNIALKMQPNFSTAYVMLANIAAKEADQAAAITQYKKALSVESDRDKQMNIYKSMSQILFDNGKYDDAIAACNEMLKLEPTNHLALFIKGMSFYKKKDLSNAATVLDQVSNTPGLDAETKAQYTFALGLVYRDRKDWERAKNTFKKSAFGAFQSVSQMEFENIKEPAEAKAN